MKPYHESYLSMIETGKLLSDKHTKDSVDAYFDSAVKNAFFLSLVT